MTQPVSLLLACAGREMVKYAAAPSLCIFFLFLYDSAGFTYYSRDEVPIFHYWDDGLTAAVYNLGLLHALHGRILAITLMRSVYTE